LEGSHLEGGHKYLEGSHLEGGRKYLEGVALAAVGVVAAIDHGAGAALEFRFTVLGVGFLGYRV